MCPIGDVLRETAVGAELVYLTCDEGLKIDLAAAEIGRFNGSRIGLISPIHVLVSERSGDVPLSSHAINGVAQH